MNEFRKRHLLPKTKQETPYDLAKSYPVRAGRRLDLFPLDDLQLDHEQLRTWILWQPVGRENPLARGGHLSRRTAHSLFQDPCERTERNLRFNEDL